MQNSCCHLEKDGKYLELFLLVPLGAEPATLRGFLRADVQETYQIWPREASVWLSAPLEAESFLCGGKCDAGESVPIDDYVSTALQVLYKFVGFLPSIG